MGTTALLKTKTTQNHLALGVTAGLQLQENRT